MKQTLQKTILLFSIIFLMSFGKTNATTFTFQGPGTDWFNPSNWLLSSSPASSTGIIDALDEVIINSPCVFTPQAPMYNPLSNFGTITLNSSLTCMFPNEIIQNLGTLNIAFNGSILNTSINNMSSGIINNNGIIFLDGPLINMLSNNGGQINNNIGGTITNNNVIQLNSGTFSNFGTINNNSSIENVNTSIFTNYGSINNNYEFYNINGGSFINAINGTFTNVAILGANIINSSSFVNNGMLVNNSAINGFNSITNNGTLIGNGSFVRPVISTGISIIEPQGVAPNNMHIFNGATLQDFTNTVINFEILGTSSYTSIYLNGAASLNGATINVYLNPGYVPANNDAFTFIDAASFTTTSPTINLPAVPGYTWTTTFVGGNLVATLTSIPLPVTLSNFDARKTSLGNELLWTIAEQYNFSHFEIEKSTNAKDFVKIGAVDLHEASNYSFIDNDIKAKTNYYKLKMVDIDNKYEYSKVVSVINEVSKILIIENNPIKAGSELNIVSSSVYQIFSINGSLIKEVKTLTPGIYFIKNKEGLSEKLIVN